MGTLGRRLLLISSRLITWLVPGYLGNAIRTKERSHRRRNAVVCGIVMILSLAAIAGASPDVVLHWTFDEASSTTVEDASGNGLYGTLTNGPICVAGTVDQAVQLNGVNQYVTAGSVNALDNLNAFTYVVWINPDSIGDNTIIDKFNLRKRFGLRTDATAANSLLCSVSRATQGAAVRATANSISLGSWQFVACTYSSTDGVRLYKGSADGESFGELTYVSRVIGSGAEVDESAGEFRLGIDGGFNRAFRGKIDEVRVYKGALSFGELRQIYEDDVGLLPPPTPEGTTYSVSSSGSDAYSCTPGVTFRTIQKAANCVRPGDKVFVSADTYYERVVMQTSGTASDPIVFEGERGPNGEQLAIIDGSDATSNWVQAPEVGAGVWKNTSIPYVPWMMTVDGVKEIWRIANRYMDGETLNINSGYPAVNGFGHLKLPTNQVVYPYGDQSSVRYWDGIEALYGYTRGTTYLRFRNGDNPNSKNIRVSPGPSSQFASPNGAAVTIRNKSFITVRGFTMRGARNAVLIHGTSASNQAAYNIIEQNQLFHGNMRVRLSGNAVNNHIRNNYMEMRSLGIGTYLPSLAKLGAAWPSRVYQRHFYNLDKFLVSGVGAEDDRDVGLHSDGTGATPTDNKISGNTMFGGAQGLNLEAHRGTAIYDNLMYAHFSQHIYWNGNVDNMQVYDNLFLTGGQYQIRTNTMEQGGSYYFYRNRFWIPHPGDHIYLGGVNSDSNMDIWFYHNSFAGGTSAFITSFKTGYGPTTLKILNNVFSTDRVVFNGWPLKMGVYDYNWQYKDCVCTPWTGTHTITSTSQLWAPGSMPSFILPAYSAPLNAGIDASASFTVQGRSFRALPGMTPGYAGADKKPDLGALQGGE